LFGRLAAWKGQHVLIEALRQLPEIHAMFVGDALFGEHPYRHELETRASAAGLADRLHWLGFRDDIPRLMSAADLVIHSSVSPEPFGRVIVEAMMARRLVIASAHGASRELLGEDYPFLVPPGDPDALATAIRTALATDPAEAARLVAANHARACNLFSTERMFADIDAAIAA
jgi:glycosyltransferase involved in cell wall biosynthesis